MKMSLKNPKKEKPMHFSHAIQPRYRGLLALCFALLLASAASAQSWVDSLDSYARNQFLPAQKYNWTWQQAPLLRAMTAQYDRKVGSDPAIYLGYVRRAIDKSMDAVWAGHNPNGVASGASLAWLARITGEAKYRTAAEQLYQKYLQIPRMPNGAIWHLKRFAELWDDTVFMVGTRDVPAHRR
jgi:unsaturated rhamnogalacturonyl hydrolase